MQYYDLSYLISPKLGEAQAKELHQKILGILQKEGAVLDRAQDVAKISLAYPVQKQREAYLAWLKFFLKREKISDILQKLSGEADLLRFIVARKEKPSKKVRRPRAAWLKKKEPVLKREKVELAEVEKKLDEIL